ncbi:hypothetical protein BD779DRAFT_1474032 [Infundibulicybe gibba]|nr:hypothetical protein BD779DRAFT_1474032 [Infundibulicybe gibba]
MAESPLRYLCFRACTPYRQPLSTVYEACPGKLLAGNGPTAQCTSGIKSDRTGGPGRYNKLRKGRLSDQPGSALACPEARQLSRLAGQLTSNGPLGLPKDAIIPRGAVGDKFVESWVDKLILNSTSGSSGTAATSRLSGVIIHEISIRGGCGNQDSVFKPGRSGIPPRP